MANGPYAFTRRFFQPDEVVISSCNFCLETVGESADNAVLSALEQQHTCSQGLRASGTLERSVTWINAAKTAPTRSKGRSIASGFTRHLYAADEVVISSCNRCLETVAQSKDERVLESLERQHSCVLAEKAS